MTKKVETTYEYQEGKLIFGVKIDTNQDGEPIFENKTIVHLSELPDEAIDGIMGFFKKD